MGMMANFPNRFEARAERRNWFARKDAEALLDWVEDCGHRFIGLEVAQKQDLSLIHI